MPLDKGCRSLEGLGLSLGGELEHGGLPPEHADLGLPKGGHGGVPATESSAAAALGAPESAASHAISMDFTSI